MKWLTKEQLSDLEFKYSEIIQDLEFVELLTKAQEQKDEISFVYLWKTITRYSFYLFTDDFKEKFKDFIDLEYLERISNNETIQKMIPILKAIKENECVVE